MILLNPDLDPDPALDRAQTKRSARSAPSRVSSSGAIPSTRALARFLGQAQKAVRLRRRVSVLLTTDGEMRRLNRQFRGINRATDVLSFPAAVLVQDKEKLAGDLAISVPTALRQSSEQGHPLGTELKVLMLHGLLHLAGYDHETDNGQMARREQRLRAQLGLPHGLIERTDTTFLRTGKINVASRARRSVARGRR
jgi:probable rRNA maturation factor